MAARRVIRPTEDVVEEAPDVEPEVVEENPPESDEGETVMADHLVDDGEPLPADDDPEESLSLETADPDQILWDGGPTVGQALEYKQKYGEIYVTTISLATGKFILWKTLNRAEYRDIMRRVEDLTASGTVTQGDAAMTQEELIAEACILVPEMTVQDFAGELAGIPSLLSQQILEASGFVALDTRGL